MENKKEWLEEATQKMQDTASQRKQDNEIEGEYMLGFSDRIIDLWNDIAQFQDAIDELEENIAEELMQWGVEAGNHDLLNEWNNRS